ncbi:MAG: DNA cytosine methyltransferase, partial [Oscillibacter sp.]|nr:DNA cytosine methyltransferase [Oscillibacter sp.]
MIQLGDIAAVNGYAVPPVDVVTGGSPCQDVSVAGARKGIRHKDLGDEAETRSGLFMEQIRVIRELRDADRKRGRTGE